ncbi:MAG: rhodanese-like domain-containing protein [Anaerolineales bacterium]|nr:rhodanese-like domain-containing protein [Anaerolineales bacterium]
MSRKIYILTAILLLMLLASACSGRPTQTEPVTKSEVPRVSVTEAKAALDNGTAVIVDVRSPAAFEASHIAGALSIPLAEIEIDPAGLKFDKTQSIITYCT